MKRHECNTGKEVQAEGERFSYLAGISFSENRLFGEPAFQRISPRLVQAVAFLCGRPAAAEGV